MKIVYNVIQQFQIINNGVPELLSNKIEVIERVEVTESLCLYTVAQTWMGKHTPFLPQITKRYTGYKARSQEGSRYQLILIPHKKSLIIASPLLATGRTNALFPYAQQTAVNNEDLLVSTLEDLFGV
jgi:hypothetical protein